MTNVRASNSPLPRTCLFPRVRSICHAGGAFLRVSPSLSIYHRPSHTQVLNTVEHLHLGRRGWAQTAKQRLTASSSESFRLLDEIRDGDLSIDR